MTFALEKSPSLLRVKGKTQWINFLHCCESIVMNLLSWAEMMCEGGRRDEWEFKIKFWNWNFKVIVRLKINQRRMRKSPSHLVYEDDELPDRLVGYTMRFLFQNFSCLIVNSSWTKIKVIWNKFSFVSFYDDSKKFWINPTIKSFLIDYLTIIYW